MHLFYLHRERPKDMTLGYQWCYFLEIDIPVSFLMSFIPFIAIHIFSILLKVQIINNYIWTHQSDKKFSRVRCNVERNEGNERIKRLFFLFAFYPCNFGSCINATCHQTYTHTVFDRDHHLLVHQSLKGKLHYWHKLICCVILWPQTKEKLSTYKLNKNMLSFLFAKYV